MAVPDISVAPYWELTFDADGDVDGAERDRLLAGVERRAVRDLIVFAHGWNNDRSGATRLYSSFFEPVPRLAPEARIGYVGVVWPSMRFCDEPVPGFPRSTAAGPAPSAALDKDTRKALRDTFPGRAPVVDALARMLDGPAREPAALEEFGRLVRRLVEDVSPGPWTRFAADTVTEGVPQREPAMFARPAVQVCAEFADALAGLGEPGGQRPFTLPNPWDGAKELLRQATYYTMKRRAGTVGERGLGPVVGRLAQAAPGVRVHLVGHSFGGRLVSFALDGLPEGVRTVKSVTLLQGAFSHYAFAPRLPGDRRAGGVLRGRERRVDGPLVCCHSRFDTALGTLYPLASRMADDDRSVLGLDVGALLGAAWGAMGHDGVQAVPGTRACTLSAALAAPFPASGCVNVDAAEVVRRGGPPAGAHSDIVHPELARVVLAAGRVR
ncbi:MULTISPECIES: serine-threonine protein kinase [unclassified Streptomyces]|uniref:serine-threonine protein kinase n=1 Tax=unclassified Streptomyces TaxID=2593676 RepID=UPI001CD80F5C|nr:MULTISPECIES: serine-threonine protein kinase [unclassified Streptomyces]